LRWRARVFWAWARMERNSGVRSWMEDMAESMWCAGSAGVLRGFVASVVRVGELLVFGEVVVEIAVAGMRPGGL
jgi:hypothetical protein